MFTIDFRLREERNRLDLNQTELDNAGGVTKEAQSNYEREIRKPDSSYWEGVAKIGADVHITGVRSKNLNEVFAMTQLAEDSNKLQGTFKLLKKDVERVVEIARRQAEQKK